jgi:hypothetical protein
MRSGDFRDQIEALSVSEAQIHENHIGGRVCDQLPGLTHRSSLAVAGHLLLLVKPQGKTAAKEGMVFDDENTNFFHRGEG